ncbi:MFS transporter [Vibrio sp.]|nr:MFS transporter [Vibrio sp.]
MSTDVQNSWVETFNSYKDKRLLWVFLLGCSSGFPWVLIGSNMSGWLTDAGLTRAAIGYFGSVFAVYAVNFLWAPLVDRVKLPILYPLLGQRRSWIILCQAIILIATLAITQMDPSINLLMTSAIALGIAVASATKDIAIDAFRIDTFSNTGTSKLPQASAMATIGWWTGYSLPGYLAFTNADKYGWNQVYYVMAIITVILMVFTLLTKEPATERERLQKEAEQRHSDIVGTQSLSWFTVTVLEPFLDFFRRNGVKVAITLLLFVFLFKIGEAFLGRMSITFYKEIGFSNQDIGYYSKLIGWGATVFFALISSAFNTRFGIVKGLLIGGSAMAGSNLMLTAIAIVGPDTDLLLFTVLVDNFTTAFSTVAFVSFLTALTGQAFSATQYALLASLGNFSRTTLSSFSGELVDYLDTTLSGISALASYITPWSVFFTITAIMVVPSLIMLVSLRDHFKKMLAE